MASAMRANFLNISNCLRQVHLINPELSFIPLRHYAARKGTREKARMKKLKVEQKKIAQAPSKIKKETLKQAERTRSIDDFVKEDPGFDNVYVMRYYKYPRYSIEEAVKCHQEIHHPTVYNLPNSLVYATIELDMVGEKKTRFLDEFKKLVLLPHPFDFGETKQVLVLTKTTDLQEEATKAGADFVGGVELIKSIEGGDLSVAEFHSVIAHTNIMTEVATIKGLLKKKFPNPKVGTLGLDLTYMISRLKRGLQFECKKSSIQNDFGWVETPIGTLDMGGKELENNFRSIIETINSVRPKREGKFITWCTLTSPPSKERLVINLKPYLPNDFEDKNENVESSNVEASVSN